MDPICRPNLGVAPPFGGLIRLIPRLTLRSTAWMCALRRVRNGRRRQSDSEFRLSSPAECSRNRSLRDEVGPNERRYGNEMSPQSPSERAGHHL